MSMTATSRLSDTDRRILESSHYTAMVRTKSGSHYTIVARDGLITLIHDDKGWAVQGTKLEIIDGGFYLSTLAGLRLVAKSTPIVACTILSN